jgi:hypothetical protein
MRPRSAALVAALSLVPVLSATRVAVAAAGCPSGTGPLPVTLTTGLDDNGVALPANAQDPHWTLVSSPVSATPAAAYTRLAHTSWEDPGPIGRWLTDGPNTVVAPAGTYTYEWTFAMPTNGAASGGFTFLFASDNGVSFTFNGVAIGDDGIPPVSGDHAPFAHLHTLTVPAPAYQAGVNRLRAAVQNVDGPVGLFVYGSLNVCDTRSACEAHGVLVVHSGTPERFGHAKATNTPTNTVVPPAWTTFHAPLAPSDDQYDAVAEERYVVGGVALHVEGAYASCALATGYRDAYGRGGVASVEVGNAYLGTPAAFVRAAEQRAQVWVGPTGPMHATDCALGSAHAGTGPVVRSCGPATVEQGPVRVTFGETWGPALEADGLTHVRSAAVHVFVDGPFTDDVDVYLGYVDVATVTP